MTMRYYIITFDRDANASYKPFHDAFVKHREINKWWHYIKSCYVIGTEMEISDLSSHFKSTAETHGIPVRHLVLRVNLDENQGWLPKDAWEWINANS